MDRSLRIAGLMLIAACDIPSGNLVTGDTADTATETQDTGYEPWSDMATQVGSEGIFGCLVQTIVPVAGDAVPDGFTKTPSDAYADVSGVWSGDFLTQDDSVIPANLDLQAPEVFRLVVVVPATGCSDYIQVEADAKVSAIPLLDETLDGVIGMRVDATLARFTQPFEQVQGTAAPMDFDPETTDTTTLNVHLQPTGSSITGDAAFEGCTAGTCVTDTALGAFTLTR